MYKKHKCSVCGLEYKAEQWATACEESHEYIYIRLKRSDLFSLLQYIQTGNQELLTKSLMSTLRHHMKGSYT